MMKKRKVTLIIEASSTGFGIYCEDFPVTAYGDTIEAAKKDLERVIADVLDFYKKEGIDPNPALNGGLLEFSFKYDIASIFNHF
jgi:predicted RNase H-like HicB family nuclease